MKHFDFAQRRRSGSRARIIAPGLWLKYGMKHFDFAQRRRCVLFALCLFAAASSFAGVTYDFRSETTGMQESTVDGNVAVEGPNLRMTVARGDGMMFKNGSTMISRDGGKTLAVYDPAAKTY